MLAVVTLPLSRFTLENQSCPSGHYLTGLSVDGTPNCISFATLLADMNCPTGRALQGFDSAGEKVCILTANGSSGGGGKFVQVSENLGIHISYKQTTGYPICPRGPSRAFVRGQFCSTMGYKCVAGDRHPRSAWAAGFICLNVKSSRA